MRGDLLTVEQSSQNAIINWGSFNIGAGSGVHFEQPNVQSSTLNRVTGDTPSTLAGSLTATGSVFLVNPNGIGISPGAIIDTGSFAASTLDIADADFLSGTMRFRSSGAAGTVTNEGTIRVRPGGQVALIGANVVNHGVIQAELGTVSLAAGEAVTLDFAGDGFLSVAASDEDLADAMGVSVQTVRDWARGGANVLLGRDVAERAMLAAVNVPRNLRAQSVHADASGRIILEGGSGYVDQGGIISAQGGDVFVGGNGVVSLGGGINASNGGSVAVQGHNVLSAGAINVSGAAGAGTVSIDASGRFIATTGSNITANGPVGGAVSINAEDGIFSSGTIEAMGSSGQGGSVSMGGVDITLVGAHVNASGVSGGGEIRIGFSGNVRAPDISANAIDVAPSTELRADALQSGDGGLIGLWSRETTNAFGTMSARGGAQSGDGGFIEASSRGDVVAGGNVDAGASHGANGTFSLDPRTIIIDDVAGIFPQYQLINPHSSANDLFSGTVTALTSGNVVVTSSANDFGATDAGAVYLFNTTTGALISAVFGSASGDNVGNAGILSLSTGNFVFRSLSWDNGGVNNAGAVTFGNGVTGVSGLVSASNSIVGTTAFDQVGSDGLVQLSNGNYLVRSSLWDNGPNVAAGALTLGNGTTGTFGAVSAANSLIGSTANDSVGAGNIVLLANGNYVAINSNWDNGANANAGAVTWGSATTGVVGVISASNSLVGSRANDNVGSGGVTALSNGNYVVNSLAWDLNATTDDVGAVTWGSGTTGRTGAVSAANSLVGAADDDRVGSGGIVELANGNYVVISPTRDNGGTNSAGAVTWASGTLGRVGTVDSTNSLVGSRTNDQVGSAGILALSNGNYVVRSPLWDLSASVDDSGAVTWGSGTAGVAGVITVANSLLGSADDDAVGAEAVLEVGTSDYVVVSSLWNNGGTSNAGAVTWGDGSIGRFGAITNANSLVGTTANDTVGSGGVTVLSNGHYVVRSTEWNNGAATDAGAVTWGNGATGRFGNVSAANSLVGSTSADRVGNIGVTALTNGNYVVNSSTWNNGAVVDAGAATWGSGTAGVAGVITNVNSLVGTTTLNQVGSDGTIALANGNYIVRSVLWDNGALNDVGAVTWGNGAIGISGNVTSLNSLIGASASDRIGLDGINILANGNFVVRSSAWNNGAVSDAGAATWGSATTGVTGIVSAANSIVGSTANDLVGLDGVTALANGNYVVRTFGWDNGAIANVGAVTFGNGSTGTSGAISVGNSLIGSTANDQVGSTGVTALSNGNYVVRSINWDNGAVANAGAATFGSGVTGISGVVSATNSLVGSTANDNVGQSSVLLDNGDYLINSPLWNNGGTADAGAVSWGSGDLGVRGVLSTANSIVGTVASQQLGANAPVQVDGGDVFIARSTGTGPGRVHVGLTNPNQLTFARAQDRTMTVRTAFITDTLNTGTDVILQANSDVILNSNLTTNNTSGDGGNLSLIAGRSILLNADITTDNGDLTLRANAGTASGVINAFRDAGSAVITMGAGADINAGTGAVRITLGTGVGQTNNASGDITLRNVTGGSVLAENLGAGNVVLASGAINASGGGASIILAAQTGNFTNLAGPSALNPGAGRFLVFSASPSLSALGGLTGDPWYGTSYNPADPDGTVPGGNRFVYSISPTLTITANPGNRPYGDANGAFGFLVSGLLGTDTQAGAVQGLPNFSTIATATSNVGNYTVTPSLGTLASAYNYNFGFANGTLTIDPRVVTVTADSFNRDYGDNNPTLTFQHTSLGAGVALTGAVTTTATASSNVGGYAITQGTVTNVNNPNYAITFVNGLLTVDPRAITVTATSLSRDYGDANPALGFTNTSLGAGLALVGSVTTTATASSNVGNYAITEGTVTEANNPNYDITFVNGVLTIDPRAVTVTADSFTRDYGDANPLLTYTNTSLGAGVALTGLLNTTATASSSVGVYSIDAGTVTTANNPNYLINFVAGSLTIDPRAVTVTANSFTRDYGDANPALTFTTTSLGAGAAIAGSLATIADATTGVGVYGITEGTVTTANNPNYIISFIDGSLTIDPRAINVIANSFTRDYGDNNPALTFTTSSLGAGAALLGALTTTATASSNVGAYGITQGSLTNANNPNYLISFTNGTLTVDPRAVTVTADSFTRDYGDNNPALTYSNTSLGAGAGLVGALVTTATASSNVGAYGITEGSLTTANNPNYIINFIDGVLTIDPRAVTVTADSFSRDYGDNNPALTFQHTSLGAGSALIGNVTTAADATSNVGGYAITQGSVTDINNPNYAITFVAGLLTVDPRAVTVTADSFNRIYGDNNPTLTFTNSSLGAGVAIAGDLTTIATASSNVGSYAITQGTVTDANNPNYVITFVNGSLGIGQRAVTVTADSFNRAYGDNNPTLTFQNTSLGAGAALAGGLFTNATASSNVGNYLITQGTLTNANNPNYLITFVNGGLTIDPRAITVTADSLSRIYGDANPTLTFTTSSLGAGAALNGVLATNATASSNVGTYGITQGTLTNANNSNYLITFIDGALTIDPRAITVTADSFIRHYGDNNPTFTYTYSDLGSGIVLVGSPTTLATAGSNVGGYAITQGTLTGSSNPNYILTFVNGTLTINPRPVTVTADGVTRDYGDNNPGLTFTHTSLGAGAALNGDLSTGATNTSNVGNYAITQGTLNALNNPNYDVTFVGGTLTITPRAITVTATDATRTYGDGNPALGFTTSDLGAGAALNGNVTTTAGAGSNVGAYGITQGSLTAGNNPNYAITFVDGVLTITPRAITITAGDITRLYGDNNGALGFTNTSLGAGAALVGSLSTDATAGSNVGGYGINQGTLTEANNANYDITFVGGTLTIIPRPITVTADDFTRIYGDANPNLTFTTSDLGAGAALNGSLSTSAGQGSNVGGYGIGAGGVTNANNSNYDITFVGGTLTITPRPITVTIDDLAKLIGQGDPTFTFDITAGSLFGSDAFTGGLTRDAGELPGDYAIRQGSLALGSNYTLTVVNGVLSIGQTGAGDLAPNWTDPNADQQQRGITSTDLTGPSGVVTPGAGGLGANDDLDLCFESQDGVCVVGP